MSKKLLNWHEIFGKITMKNVERPGELNTILGKGSYFKGDIKVEHSLRIDGKIEGDVTTSQTIIVGAEGVITGNVVAKSLILGGKISGSLIASSKTVLESKSAFHGDIKTAKLMIDDGAVFDGTCSMTKVDGSVAIKTESTET